LRHVVDIARELAVFCPIYLPNLAHPELHTVQALCVVTSPQQHYPNADIGKTYLFGLGFCSARLVASVEEWGPNEGEEASAGHEELDPRVAEAIPKVSDILDNVTVATDRELKVRLEKEYFPWVVGRTLGVLIKDGVVEKVGYPGRRRVAGTEVISFYVLSGTEYFPRFQRNTCFRRSFTSLTEVTIRTYARRSIM